MYRSVCCNANANTCSVATARVPVLCQLGSYSSPIKGCGMSVWGREDRPGLSGALWRTGSHQSRKTDSENKLCIHRSAAETPTLDLNALLTGDHFIPGCNFRQLNFCYRTYLTTSRNSTVITRNWLQSVQTTFILSHGCIQMPQGTCKPPF